MWARVIQIILSFWLMASPIIFLSYVKQATYWEVDILAASVVVIFSFLGCFSTFELLGNLTVLTIALFVVVFSFFPYTPTIHLSDQNRLAIGVLWMILSLVPLKSSDAP